MKEKGITQVDRVYEGMSEMGLEGKRVLVVGSVTPWIEGFFFIAMVFFYIFKHEQTLFKDPRRNFFKGIEL